MRRRLAVMGRGARGAGCARRLAALPPITRALSCPRALAPVTRAFSCPRALALSPAGRAFAAPGTRFRMAWDGLPRATFEGLRRAVAGRIA
ncbi:hypothetical protein D3C71_1881830 [compost metagenome]